MQGTIQPHRGKDYTMAKMAQLVCDYSGDLKGEARQGLPLFFERVRAIPYVEDFEAYAEFPKTELVARPKYLMDRELFPKLDCKKKAILLAAWARENGHPWRFVAVCEDGSGIAHHVFPQILVGGEWKNADATFPWYEFGELKPNVTHAWEFAP